MELVLFWAILSWLLDFHKAIVVIFFKFVNKFIQTVLHVDLTYRQSSWVIFHAYRFYRSLSLSPSLTRIALEIAELSSTESCT